MLKILQLPVLQDNYIYLLHEPSTSITAVVDPAVAEPVLDTLQRHKWHLHFILNTHHHSDHVGGNLALKQATGCKIVASRYDRERIPGIDITVDEGDVVNLGNAAAQVLLTPGHTLGHIAYFFAEDAALFCGDTLFAMGCGRLFEGTAAQMQQSLSKLRDLPGETKVYCAHEYTQANGRFALTVEPENPALQQKMQFVNSMRAGGKPTVPSTLAEERATNPFLRWESLELQKNIHRQSASPAAVFTEVRLRKDHF